MKRCFFILLVSYAYSTYAFTWENLWIKPDKQGEHLMRQKKYKEAQQAFQNPDWQAAAAYKAGNYQEAIKGFRLQETEEGYYNLGNALAQTGKYEQALNAYDKALSLNPHHQDALYNRKLVEDLLKKEKEQNRQQNKNQQKNQDEKTQTNEEKSSSSQENQPSDKKEEKQQNQPSENKQTPPEEKKAKQQEQTQKKENQEPKTTDNPEKAKQTTINQEKQQAKEQWLRLIPDDPGGLLRGKFLRDHLRRLRGWHQ